MKQIFKNAVSAMIALGVVNNVEDYAVLDCADDVRDLMYHASK